MRRNKLLWYALIGGGVYYLWSKNRPVAMPLAVAAPRTPGVAGFGHQHPMWGPGYGGMANVYARGQW